MIAVGDGLVWHWTIVVTVGFVFAGLNIWNRQANIRALKERKRNGQAMFAAQWLRNVEIVRAAQLLVLLGVGVGGIYIQQKYHFPPPAAPSTLDGFTRFYLNHITDVFLVFAYAITFNSVYTWVKSKGIRVFQQAPSPVTPPTKKDKAKTPPS